MKSLFCPFLMILFMLPVINIQATAFITTWKTDNAGTSSSTQITIPGTGTYDVEWVEVGVPGNNGSTSGTGSVTVNFPYAGTYQVSIPSGMTRINFNNGGDKLKLLTIEQWGTLAWTSMASAFYGCTNLTHNAVDAPDLSSVTNVSNMFTAATSFNGAIGNWDVSNITNMNAMLYNATSFNQDISTWNVSNVTTMRDIFNNATAFNQNISGWDVSNVTDMYSMFWSAIAFNQNIGGWNVSNVTNMNYMFKNASAFDQDLGNWDISSVTIMTTMLQNSGISLANYDNILIGWEAQSVTGLTIYTHGLNYCNGESARNSLINTLGWTIVGDSEDCSPFVTTWKTNNSGTSSSTQITIPGTGSYDIEWEEVGNPSNNGSTSGTGSVTVNFPYAGTYEVSIPSGLTQISFNHGGDKLKLLTIEQWGILTWISMQNAFAGCSNLTYNATDVPDLSAVTDMSSMFSNCTSFNGAIGGWDVSSVVNMGFMFYEVGAFNQDIGGWDVSNVTSMTLMFREADLFNQDISGWDVSSVTNLSGMFQNADLFNQDISGWDVSSNTTLASMFEGATAFDQNLSSWDVTAVTTMGLMLSNSGLSPQNYDNTLIGWAAQAVRSGVSLGATGMEYCDGGEAARNDLINNFSWSISGDSKDCSTFPVEWLNFTAKPTGESVLLDWTTASELNTDFFAVERSADQQSWKTLAQVSAAGYSSTAQNYRYDDTQPLNGKTWYRLRQVDLDGSFDYSHIVEISQHAGLVSIYPNPVKDKLTIETQAPVTARLFDMQGRVVMQHNLDSGKQTLLLHDLPSGIYLIRLSNEKGWTQEMQVVKE